VDIERFIQSLPVQVHRSNLNGKIICTEVPVTPVFLYSSAALKRNVDSYLDAINTHNLNGILGYAVKANENLHILKALKSCGVQMPITVSGNEVLASLSVGFQPENILFNGNGKQEWEIKLAIEQGVLMNVDSVFDAKRIVTIAANHFPTTTVKVLLRAQPSPANSIPISVHPYVNTSESSKFGFNPDDLDIILDILRQHEKIKIEGVHCHLGSCIDDPGVFTYTCEFIADISSRLKKKDISVKVVDIGGGVGINYYEDIPGISLADQGAIHKLASKSAGSNDMQIPTVAKFMEAIVPYVPRDAKIIFEPGRSLVGNAGILISKFLGSKNVGLKKYKVCDASMAEIIRPCLYNAHHQIYPVSINQGHSWDLFDVVGPICETADFLGVNIPLQVSEDNPLINGTITNDSSNYLAIMNCGAYGSSMSSNYNMKPRPQEILVDGTSWRCIRQRDSYENLVEKYIF